MTDGLPTALRKVLTEPFTALMREGWLAPVAADVTPHPAAALRSERRRRLAAAFPGELLVVPTGRLKTRNNDIAYRFRPGTAFTWLVGSQQPDAVLVVHPDGRIVLHQHPPFDRDGWEWHASPTGEVFDGPRPPLEQVAAHLAIEVEPMEHLEKLRGQRARVLRGVDPLVEQLVDADEERDRELAAWLGEQRLVKDAWEVEQLQEAVDLTVRGFEDVVRSLPRAVETSERWLEGVFALRARLEGNDVGYGSICASGAHACTLHYIDNDGAVRPGELLLLDMGVENRELYTADITRTLPVSGLFTPLQRRLYDLVLEAQEAGIAKVRPGAHYDEPYDAAMAVLARGLEELGLLDSAEQALRPDDLRYRRWTAHRVSHMLGLDVHDCAGARDELYSEGHLQVGNVLTVEPGLYFRHDDALVPEELRGIGIRLEDDVLVTPDGCRVLSAALPRRADEVEAWMARLQQEASTLP